ncbi:type III-A CRISPR-associated RAMP protein Csm3 [Thermovibrio sp.]
MGKRLWEVWEVEGELLLKTGLHIGIGRESLKIGGVENQIVRDPLTGMPYIPGSSLKGRLRALLELYFGLFSEKGDVLSYKSLSQLKRKGLEKSKFETGLYILKLFGTSADEAGLDEEEINEVFPSRLVVPDLFLKEASASELRERVGSLMAEEKTEVKINRITGTTYSAALNQSERVPAGAVFKFNLRFKTFKDEEAGWEDSPQLFLNLLATAFYLLELNGLGGRSSRGYGMVEVFSKEADKRLIARPRLSKRKTVEAEVKNHFAEED